MADTNPVHVLNPFETVRALCQRVTKEVAERVVGQQDAVACLTAGLLLGGNVLMEGVPGLGKTLLAKTLADVVALRFSRIQFTPDLMPADILGTHIVSMDGAGKPQLTLQKGPLFANVILADEINRASPKTQSALLEAMQEKQISLGTTTYALPPPYFVVATQNPLDNEGTYPLPEAQLDRFLMKLIIRFPSEQEVLDIVGRTTGLTEQPVQKVADADAILHAGRAIRQMPVADFVSRYAVQLVFATHPEAKSAPAAVRRYVKYGASPRAAQALVLVGKFFALLDGRLHVAVADVQKAAVPCLRHRIIRNFDAIADNATTDDVIMQILGELPLPPEAKARK
jgi:MoxR-like ATPase